MTASFRSGEAMQVILRGVLDFRVKCRVNVYYSDRGNQFSEDSVLVANQSKHEPANILHLKLISTMV